MYYYNARYYDPSIGRFISPDPTIPDPKYPQTLNRYSYCINNPLKLIDPSGLDYVIIGVSGSEANKLYTKYYDLYLLAAGTGEKVVFLPDLDSDNIILLDFYNIQSRLNILEWRLEQGDLSNIKLIGFSEGAATVAKFLSNLADDPNYMSSSVRKELHSATLLECITDTRQSLAVLNYDSTCLNYLPQRLQNAGINIRLADVWNTASIVHGTGPLSGWEGGLSHPYDSRPVAQRNSFLGILTRMINTGQYHEEILRDKYALEVTS